MCIFETSACVHVHECVYIFEWDSICSQDQRGHCLKHVLSEACGCTTAVEANVKYHAP